MNFNADMAMGQILASSILVTPENFPELNLIVDDCAAKLNIHRPYVVVTSQIPGINAVTFGSDEEPYIVITSLLVKIMTEPGMRFVIGHECGHIAMGHVIYHTSASTLGQFSQITTSGGAGSHLQIPAAQYGNMNPVRKRYLSGQPKIILQEEVS